MYDNDYKQTSLWMVNINGSGLRQVIANGQNGWAVQGHAEWSPDGTKLVMFGGTIYNGIVVTDTNGVQLHRVGNGIDPVWSSNGKQIIYINCAKGSRFPVLCAGSEPCLGRQRGRELAAPARERARRGERPDDVAGWDPGRIRDQPRRLRVGPLGGERRRDQPAEALL